MTPEAWDPYAAEVLDMVDEARCGGCDGLGVVVDAAPVAGGLLLITWRWEHAAGCSGLPEVAYCVDIAAIDRGDFALPAQPWDRPRPRCSAVASSTGRQCRNRARAAGLCEAHRPRVGGQP